MEDFLREWSYLGVFLGIVATGIGLPISEELPVVVGGLLVGLEQARWWLMLPTCIIAVIIGDGFLYGIGRFFGPRLLQHPFLKKRLLPPERLQRIKDNFNRHGVKILLFARLTPGIRAPIFLTAGITHLSFLRFLLADAIYAIPGVSLLFFLGYAFTERMVTLIHEEAEMVKSVIILVVVGAVAIYVAYRFLRKPMVTGDPHEMPPVVEQVTHTLEQVTSKIMHPHGEHPPAPPDGQPAPHQEKKPAEEGR